LKNIEMFLKGKRSRLEAGLKRQMKAASRAQRYEEAASLRDSLEALRHINDVALLKEESGFVATQKLSFLGNKGTKLSFSDGLLHRPEHLMQPYRIEAYDISHTFGHAAVGSMVVFTNGKVDAGEFRKFRIRAEAARSLGSPSTRSGSLGMTMRGDARWIDDTAMLKQVLTRRLKHKEWPMPDLILMDGGAAQLHAAHEVLKRFGLKIPALALAKGPKRKRADLYTADSSVKLIPIPLLVKLREQAHRFAIRYHRTLRERTLIG
jgi:excinuclease UvrABC nuclease subunit